MRAHREGIRAADTAIVMDLTLLQPQTTKCITDSPEISFRTGTPMKTSTQQHLTKLRVRKKLLLDKRRLCAWALGTALLGIFLMILHTESCWLSNGKITLFSYLIKWMITFSTLCLLGLIIAFHCKDIKLYIIDQSLEDWLIAITWKRLFFIFLELLVCMLHPFPIVWSLAHSKCGGGWQEDGNSSAASSPSSSSSSQPVFFFSGAELLLCNLMFLRLYLFHRAILLHSKVLLSASYRSIGSLNNINFHFRFVLKVLMKTYPGRTLLFIVISLLLIAAWMLSICERGVEHAAGRMDDALWLIAITFLTVGYGDMYPYTTCGRIVCLMTGVMGLGCTALLVAVVANKLEFNKAEKHVHNFMRDIQCYKKLQNAAADVLRECWLLHRSRRWKRDSQENRQKQRDLLEAIQLFRKARLDLRKLRDRASETIDLSKLQMIMCDLDANWKSSYKVLEHRIDSMEKKIDDLGKAFQNTSLLMASMIQQWPAPGMNRDTDIL
ncbi:intermediate conductance calcium-activated potassium channel protein 4 [Erpetoichthys calabaricus]|uniref:Potassium calcium-activated channel subfamily N member 4 n=1 Tax=Erpetoichthys calabaricus TaxID=27687 RepID=A0A8C4T5H1_ERPCA|nr:intermediate conductance calcium-activated potassium channel protein 4 [Erpetoichthys calabaricus]